MSVKFDPIHHFLIISHFRRKSLAELPEDLKEPAVPEANASLGRIVNILDETLSGMRVYQSLQWLKVYEKI